MSEKPLIVLTAGTLSSAVAALHEAEAVDRTAPLAPLIVHQEIVVAAPAVAIPDMDAFRLPRERPDRDWQKRAAPKHRKPKNKRRR